MIFLDWALEAAKADMHGDLKVLLNEYSIDNPSHPMTQVITDGLNRASETGRRGGRAGRHT